MSQSLKQLGYRQSQTRSCTTHATTMVWSRGKGIAFDCSGP
ncbi:MAG: hypothetical protein ACPMAQ_15650 [Phycisphaerae bacterium]